MNQHPNNIDLNSDDEEQKGDNRVRQRTLSLKTKNAVTKSFTKPPEKFEDIPLTQSVSFAIPSRQTSFGYSITKAMSLMTFNPREKTFCMPETTKSLLESFEKPCYVLSVSGNPLVGKSTILNLLISYLTYQSNDSLMYSDAGGLIPYQQVYQVGDGKRSTTEGIDMYCLSYEDKNVMIMDIEGDNDPNRKDMGVWMYTNFITTAVAISHLHMYNYTGLPQQSFMEYFRSINKLTKGNKLHTEFDTLFYYLKRNHPIFDEEDVQEDLEEISDYFVNQFSDIYKDGCIHLLKTPPDHIINQKGKDSCVKNQGFICEQCQKDLFFKLTTKLFEETINLFDQTPAYKNGTDLIKTVEQVLELNKRDLPFTADLGHLSKIRVGRFRKEQNRITKELLEVQPHVLERKLSKQIQEIIEEHPGLSDAKILEDFEQAITTLTTKIAQIEYFMPEVTQFVEEVLLDRTQTILDSEEKELVMNTYVNPFVSISVDILDSLKKYEKIADQIIEKLELIKDDISKNLKEYITAVADAKQRTTVLATNTISSGVLGLIAREVGVRVFAGFLIGGGAIGAVLTVVVFLRAKKNFDKSKQKNMEAINATKIVGIDSVQEAEEELKKVESFIGEIVQELKDKNKTLKEICSEEKSRNYVLAEQIESYIDKKMECKEISLDENVKIIQSMKVAQNNVERFKDAI